MNAINSHLVAKLAIMNHVHAMFIISIERSMSVGNVVSAYLLIMCVGFIRVSSEHQSGGGRGKVANGEKKEINDETHGPRHARALFKPPNDACSG